MGSLDLDHQGKDLWEHRAFIGHSQMAEPLLSVVSKHKVILSSCQEKDVISEVMLY